MNIEVMVVDDSSTARRIVQVSLGDLGIKVVEAVNGRDGILKLGQHPDVRIVFCDVNMPIMSGLEMLSVVHDSGLAQDRVFLMLSANDNPRHRDHARRLGAAGWILKPLLPNDLVAVTLELAATARHA